VSLLILDAALHELREAIEYYELQRPGLGAEFAREVGTAIQRIIDHPNAWAIVKGRIRRCQTKRFPYGILYHHRKGEVLIVAVMHLHRHPDYWKDRVR